jgi:hypothetical protein
MRVLVCGGRDYRNESHVYKVLNGIHKETPIALVINGGACGADTFAGWWAARAEIPCLSVPAKWNKYGSKAGPMRNDLMCREHAPDLVVAFPGGKGTANMIATATDYGIRVVFAEPDPERKEPGE